MEKSLQIAVIGCGRMGQLHLQALQQVEHFKLAAIVEPVEERRTILQQLYNCKAYEAPEEIQEPLDAVTIATPSPTHYLVAETFLEKGIPCLIEKPLALHPHEVESLLNLENKAPILVGYSERYNPTFLALQEALKNQQILAISTRRLSYAPDRKFDTDVMLDLMVHDIDLILALAQGSIIKHIQGQCFRTDHCDALIHFENGIMANLTASRLTPDRIREFTVTTPTQFYKADLLNHRLDVSLEAQETKPIHHHLTQQPLVTQYHHFHEVITKRAKPNVGASQAHQGLSLIWKLQESLNLKEPF